MCVAGAVSVTAVVSLMSPLFAILRGGGVRGADAADKVTVEAVEAVESGEAVVAGASEQAAVVAGEPVESVGFGAFPKIAVVSVVCGLMELVCG